MTDQQFNELRELVARNTADTAEIRRAIVGDPQMGVVGLADRVKRNEEGVAEFKSCKAKMAAWAAGVGTAAGGGVTGLIHFLKTGNN